MIAERTMTHMGSRSNMSPRLTTTAFIRGSRSTVLAVKIWGRNQAPWAIRAAIPMGIGLSVNLLMNNGTIVAAEMKLRPNQKATTSSMLTVKFQRRLRVRSSDTWASVWGSSGRST